MPFTAKKLILTESQKTELITISRSTKSEHRMVERATIILMLSENQPYSAIKEKLKTNDTKISKWKRRFLAKGMEGLKDDPRSGKKSKYNDYDKVRITQLACSKPEDGYTNWSQARIGKKLGISQSTVNRVLKSSKLKPHKTEYWCGKSTDPEFEEKMLIIVGLYLAPPDNALVLCVDEKTQIQALDRTQPELPMREGSPKRQTATYKRNGTVSLITSLSV